MNLVEVNKVLSNRTRVAILDWLKEPERNFPPHKELGHFDFGVCGQFIFEKSGLSQSTISNYLTQLEKVGLIIPTRLGKWTYFKRDEENISNYIKELSSNL